MEVRNKKYSRLSRAVPTGAEPRMRRGEKKMSSVPGIPLSKFTPTPQISRLNSLTPTGHPHLLLLYKNPPQPTVPERTEGSSSSVPPQGSTAQLLQAANTSPSSLLPPPSSVLPHSRRDKTTRAYVQDAHAGPPPNQSRLVWCGNGPPRPALGRDDRRPAAGLRPRQAPQVLLLLPLLLLLVVLPSARSRRSRRRVSAGAGGDAQHHHRPPAVAVRRRLAARRVLQLLRPVLPGQHARLAVRHSYHAQGGRLEEVPPENQGLRWPGARRRAQEPHRVRLGGDQFVGPLS